MIFDFKRLASLQDASLDLKQLTVIIGPNNSNKTYLAYSLYAILDGLRDAANDITLPFSKFENQNSISFECDEKFLAEVHKLVKNSGRRAIKQLSEFFQDSTKFIFADSIVKISISDDDIRASFERVAKRLNKFEYFGFTVIGNWSEKDKKAIFIFEQNKEEGSRGEERIEINVSSEFAELFSYILLTDLFPKPFALPAERNALILTYRELLGQRYRSIRNGRRRLSEEQIKLFTDRVDQVPESWLPKPIEDFLEFLLDLMLSPNQRRWRLGNKDVYQELANLLVKSLYNGVTLDLEEVETGGRQIVVHLDNEHNIDLHNASTSIKQLTSLFLYLKYQAREGDLLIVDEPEMNLHPRSQAILLEILAILSNLGVKILLTTHSPFVLAHLNNLIASKQANTPERLFLNDERAQLSLDEVSAYEVVNHTLKSLKDEDFGISWQSFSDVASDIQTRLFQIYDTLEVE